MKKSILKNKLIIFTLVLMGIFFVDIRCVFAKNSAAELSGGSGYVHNTLSAKDITLQCIYADGGLYTYSYNAGNGEFVINRNTYNLKGVSEIDNTASSLMQFVNVPYKRDDPSVSKYLTCADYVSSTVFVDPAYEGNDYKKGQSVSFYKFGGELTKDEISGGESHWYNFFGISSKRETAAEDARRAQKSYELVSESYILSNDAPMPNNSLYYAMPATQAAGTDKYVQVLIYDNVVLLKSDSLTTRLDGGNAFSGLTSSSNAPASLSINSPEPSTEISGSKIYYYYKEGQVRYKTGGSKKYELTNSVPPQLNGNDSSDLCDEVMPETAKILKEVIQYARFIIPALLIVLVAIDLGKIVVSGNVDEDMPKQRRKVVTRIVIAVVFFFLPFLVDLLLNLAINSGASNSSTIQTIECLFE